MTDAAPAELWVRRLRAHGDPQVRVICFAHAGGSASTFIPLARLMNTPIEVCGVQSPGREDRRGEACLDSVAALAAGALPEVLARADRPIVLFGHSLGAAVAFEVGRSLEAAGVRPLALFVSGRRAPSVERRDTVHLRSEAGLRAELRLLGGHGLDLLADPAVRRAYLPVIRSDYRAAETYRAEPGARVTCDLTALIGDHDPRVNRSEAQRWQAHTGGRFQLLVLPGGHFQLWENWRAVAAAVDRELVRAL